MQFWTRKSWTRMSRSLWLGALLTLSATLSGCVTTETVQRPKELSPPPGAISQVHAIWENRVMVTQDVVNNGAPLLGLGGRIYLFGDQVGYPQVSNGAAIVELADLTHADAQHPPKVLERWEIDKATLQRLLKKDTIGWGYTIFLPWGTYRPDITQVQLQVRYLPEKGLPLFSPPAMVALRKDGDLVVTQRQAPASSPASGSNNLPGLERLPPLPAMPQTPMPPSSR
jgi:hypothetical protein